MFRRPQGAIVISLAHFRGETRRTAWFGLILGAILLAYLGISWQAIDAPFFSLDDIRELYLVRQADSWTQWLGGDLFQFFRPVKNFLFAAYDALAPWGMRPVRLLAVSVGVLSALAVFRLCLLFLGHRGWALGAMALWALAPTMVSCTAWLSCTNILVMVCFAAAAVCFHDRAAQENIGPRITVGWLALGIASLALALASYEGAISVVPIIFACDFYLRPARLRHRRVWGLYAVYAAIILVYLVARFHTQARIKVWGYFSNITLPQLVLSSAYFTVQHVGSWLWPFGRMAVIGYYSWGQTPVYVLVGCWLLIAILIVFALAFRKPFPLAALGIAWFLLGFAPMSNILGFRNGPYGDYYLALASVGLALAMTAGVRRLLQRSGGGRAAAAAIFFIIVWRLAAAVEGVSWSASWNDERLVYERNIRIFPHAFNVMTELAKCYVACGKYQQADRLAQKALLVTTNYLPAYAVRAVVAQREGRFEDALAYARYCEESSELSAWAYNFEAFLREEHFHKPDEAIALYRKAVEKRPWNEDAVNAADALAYLLVTKGNRREAIELWEEAARYNPDCLAYHNNLAVAYQQDGHQEKAAKHKTLTLSLKRQKAISEKNKRLPE